MEWITILITFLTSTTVTAVVLKWMDRQRAAADTRLAMAEADKADLANQQSSVDFYRNQVKETIAEMTDLRQEVKELKAAVEAAQTKYEQRVGSLHEKIDTLVKELERANRNLDEAKNTISELRKEVKDGNAIIAELRKEISKLLVDRAKKNN